MDAILVLGWIAPNFTLSAACAQRISGIGESNSAECDDTKIRNRATRELYVLPVQWWDPARVA
jgi:hypothetical protein